MEDIICPEKRTHFWKRLLFCSQIDVKYIMMFAWLFVCLVCDRPNKKTAEDQWLYFASEFDSDLEIVDLCLEEVSVVFCLLS